MNKIIYIIGIIVLLSVVSVTAYTPIDYKERCEIIRPATEFRAEKSFGMIGIWGRLSNGSLICFTPGNNIKSKEINSVVEPPVIEPPVIEPPVIEPPVIEPPVIEPPVCIKKKVCNKCRCHIELICNVKYNE